MNLISKNIDKLIDKQLNNRAGWKWYVYFIISLSLMSWGAASLYNLLFSGVGEWGLNSGTTWGMAITNFVFWIGIGHACTLISAILFLFRQKWRNALSRSAEAMTLAAIVCAGIFPIIHTGRPWFSIYWLIPYPGSNSVWPNFKSPLEWDFFAISSYLIISLLFWYLGLIPDLGHYYGRVKSRFKKFLVQIFIAGLAGIFIPVEGLSENLYPAGRAGNTVGYFSSQYCFL